jgi:23S rRNA pseudouridine2605 synthase
MKMVRLDRLLANRGLGSRNEIHKLIRSSRITIAGEIVTKRDFKLPEDTIVQLDGLNVDPLPIALLWHKPINVVSTMSDPLGRPDLTTSLPPQWQGKYHPVGRLDLDTSGLLLFSRSGALTQWLLHPKRAVQRWYRAIVENPVPDDLGARLAAGIQTSMGVFPAALDEHGTDWVKLSVTEGKHRMVRRVLNNAGHPVVSLHRLQYGPMELGELPCGAVRPISTEERASLTEMGAPL